VYFVTPDGRVYHVLKDVREGAALCGARPHKYDLACLLAGKPTRRFFAERPPDIPPCKLCGQKED
jgi:hypothetical protein